MDALGSLVLFAVIIIAFSIIIEIFTVLFRLTGMTQEKAKTQVISMLTNSGFTTSESEIILASKKRRKLAQITMLFGYSFSVIIVSIVVNIFLTLNQAEMKSVLATVIMLLVGLALLVLITRLQVVQRKFDYLIERIGNRIMFGKKSNIVVLIDNYSNQAMAEIFLENIPAFLDQVRLADTRLKEIHGIQILLIKRDGGMISGINGDTMLCSNDILVVFGNYKNIRAVFEHPDAIRN